MLAWDPTGINAGVLTWPWDVWISPNLASEFLSFLTKRNSKAIEKYAPLYPAECKN
jgi:hypothetical protein